MRQSGTWGLCSLALLFSSVFILLGIGIGGGLWTHFQYGTQLILAALSAEGMGFVGLVMFAAWNPPKEKRDGQPSM